MRPRRGLEFVLITIACIVGTTQGQAQRWSDLNPPEGKDWVGQFANSSDRVVGIFNSELFFTSDGSTWEKADLNERVEIVGFQYGRFWTITSERIYESEDGESWLPAGLMPEPSAQGMAFQRTPFGAVCARWTFGQAGGVLVVSSRLYVSEDLQTWDLAGDLPGMGADRSFTLTRSGLVQGGDTIVANYWVRGDGIPLNFPQRRMAWSINGGRTWQHSAVENNSPPAGLSYGNGTFMGIWSLGDLMYSTDGGRSFGKSTVVTPEELSSEVFFAGKRFFTRANNQQVARVYESVDGLAWNSVGDIGVDSLFGIRGVAYGFGRYFLGGIGGEDGSIQVLGTITSPPVLVKQPGSREIAEGRALRLSVEAVGDLPTSFQWMKNGVAIAGALGADYVVSRVTEEEAGSYRCEVSNSSGTVFSNTALVQVIPATVGGRLVNLSVNTVAGSGDETVNIGFVVKGPVAKALVVRAIGPSLAQFDVADAAADPVLKLMQGGNEVVANDNWLGNDGRDLGAFALEEGSLDAVLADLVESNVYSIVADSDSGSGRILTEVYDGNLDAAESLLLNLSARVVVEESQTLIVGFVVGGSRPLDLLIRAIGPGLSDFGISNPMVNPTISLFSGSSTIITVDNWSGDDGRALGAFPLEPGSKDSVISVRLDPGVYSAHITSASSHDESGVLLLELYDAN